MCRLARGTRGSKVARLHHALLAVSGEVKLVAARVHALLNGALDLGTVALRANGAFTFLLQAVG